MGFDNAAVRELMLQSFLDSRQSLPISSYNRFLERAAGIVDFFDDQFSRLEISKEQQVVSVQMRLVAISIAPPTEYPNEARTKLETYYAPVNMTVAVDLHDAGSGAPPEKTEHVLMDVLRVPLMVNSSLCAMTTGTADEKMKAGENLADEGGYFILRGNLYSLKSQLVERPNCFVTTVKGDCAQSSMLSRLRNGSRQVASRYVEVFSRLSIMVSGRRRPLPKSNSVQLSYSKADIAENVLTLTEYRGLDHNCVFVWMMFFGAADMDACESLVQSFLPEFSTDSARAKVTVVLETTRAMVEVQGLTTPRLATEHLVGRKGKLTPEKIDANVFVHLHDEGYKFGTKENMHRSKLLLLAEMTASALAASADDRPTRRESQDHLNNQVIFSPGSALDMLFCMAVRSKYVQLVNRLKGVLASKATGNMEAGHESSLLPGVRAAVQAVIAKATGNKNFLIDRMVNSESLLKKGKDEFRAGPKLHRDAKTNGDADYIDPLSQLCRREHYVGMNSCISSQPAEIQSACTQFQMSNGAGLQKAEKVEKHAAGRHLTPVFDAGRRCMTNTPEDKDNCGLSSHLAMTAVVSLGIETSAVMATLADVFGAHAAAIGGYFFLREGQATECMGRGLVVKIESAPVARLPDADCRTVVQLLRAARAADHNLHHMSFDTTRPNTINVVTTAGRILRPLLVVDQAVAAGVWVNEPLWPKLQAAYADNWEFLNVPLYAAVLPSRSTAFLERASAASREQCARLQEMQLSDHVRAGNIEYLDATEEASAALVYDYGGPKSGYAYTHCELTKLAFLSATPASIVCAHMNPSCRQPMKCKIAKQATCVRGTNFLHVFESSQQPLFGERRCSMTNTMVDRCMLRAGSVLGIASETPILVAVMFHSDNLEDGIVLNKHSVQGGMFKNIAKVTVTLKIEHERIGLDFAGNYTAAVNGMEETEAQANVEQFRHLRGASPVVEVGTVVRRGDVLIAARTLVADATQGALPSSRKPYTDASKYFCLPDVDEARVVAVYHRTFTPVQHSSYATVISVMLVYPSVVEVGTKLCSDHGQKTVVTRITADMPRTEDGICPDAIFNPCAMPTRMTYGQAQESVQSMLAAKLGRTMDGTAFECTSATPGETEHAYHTMFDPHSGKKLDGKVFMGFIRYVRTHHHAAKKIQVRGPTGARDQLTGQPVSRISQNDQECNAMKNKGLRSGFMEICGYIAHRAPHIVYDRMMVRADKVKVWVCEEHGKLCLPAATPMGPSEKPTWACRYADCSSQITKVEVPKVITHVMESLESANVELCWDKVKETPEDILDRLAAQLSETEDKLRDFRLQEAAKAPPPSTDEPSASICSSSDGDGEESGLSGFVDDIETDEEN